VPDVVATIRPIWQPNNPIVTWSALIVCPWGSTTANVNCPSSQPGWPNQRMSPACAEKVKTCSSAGLLTLPLSMRTP
jgi:hypothetical protein